MIRCIVIDDKPLAIDILTAYIQKVPQLELAYTTRNPLEALDYLQAHPVDLIFLDIQMPELSGLQFMKLRSGNAKVILTTAYADYAMEGYEHDVLDYLLKPIAFDRFYKAVEKARGRLDLAPGAGDTSLFIKTDYKIQRIPLDDIRYIEAKQNYIAIMTSSGKTMSLQHIKSIEEKLPADRFIRVHNSFIVAVDKIDTIERSRIFIGEASIPIGDSYREGVFRRLGG